MRAARGLSLVELLVAMAMSSTVLVGAVAAIGIGGRAFRSATDGVRSASTTDALAQISSDIELALAFTERTNTTVAFYVPDRTGDGAPELVRYAWGGTDGDPLTRSMNGSTPVAIVDGVSRLSLDYVVAAVQGQPTFAAAPPATPNDELLFERDFTDSGNTHALGPTASVAAIVSPTISGSRFRVTRVRVPMSAVSGGGPVMVSVHRVNMVTATPEATALASATVRQADLPGSLNGVEVDITSMDDFAAGDFVAIVISQGTGGSSAVVALEPSPQFLTDGWIATTSALGVWGVNATRDMPIEIYGVIDADQGQTQQGGGGGQQSQTSQMSGSQMLKQNE